MNATQHSSTVIENKDKTELPEEDGSEPDVAEGAINVTGESAKKKRHRKKKKPASAAVAAVPDSDSPTTPVHPSSAGAPQLVDKLVDGLAHTSLPKTNERLEEKKEDGDDEEDEKPGAEGEALFFWGVIILLY